jgi:hypothetical protein
VTVSITASPAGAVTFVRAATLTLGCVDHQACQPPPRGLPQPKTTAVPVKVGLATIGGAHPQDFKIIANACDGAIAPPGCGILVAFSPMATGTLSIGYGDSGCAPPCGSQWTCPLHHSLPAGLGDRPELRQIAGRCNSSGWSARRSHRMHSRLPGASCQGRPHHADSATGPGTVDLPAVGSGYDSHDALRRTTTTPTVLFGGVPAANVQFSGLAPPLVGVNQVNAEISGNAPKGPASPLQLHIGGNSTTGKVTIAIE